MVYRVLPERLDRRGRERVGALDRLKQDTVAESFARLRRTALDRGFGVLVIVFPEFRRYTAMMAAKHNRVAQLSRRNGFRHVDLKETCEICAREHGRALVTDWFHPSASGHRCAARAIADYLADEVLQRPARASGQPDASCKPGPEILLVRNPVVSTP